MIKPGSHTAWTKSSYSTGNGACVVVRSQEAESIQVGDSKIPAAVRPALAVSPSAFTALVEHVRA